jgi:hypothetical protein
LRNLHNWQAGCYGFLKIDVCFKFKKPKEYHTRTICEIQRYLVLVATAMQMKPFKWNRSLSDSPTLVFTLDLIVVDKLMAVDNDIDRAWRHIPWRKVSNTQINFIG